jgi:hypothetical protein
MAVFTALGAGFGFSLGNFFQTAGTASGVGFNWWNVMEFTLGFFGGLGLAYGALTVNWPVGRGPSRIANRVGLVFILILIPITNVIQTFEFERLANQAQLFNIADTSRLAFSQLAMAWTIILVLAAICLQLMYRGKVFAEASVLFLLLLFAFLLMSHIRKAVLYTGFLVQPEQAFYGPLTLAILFLWWRNRNRDSSITFPAPPDTFESVRQWAAIGITLLTVLTALAWISTQLHDGLPGAQQRF